MKLRSHFVSCLLACAALLLAAPVLAQNTSSAISGRVLDAAGQPVEGATVQIVHVPSSTTKVVSTDANGRYSAQGLRVGGPFEVTASKAGFTQAERGDVYLQLAQDSAVDLTLAGGPSDIQELGVTTVTADALAQTFASENRGFSTNVSRRDLDATPMPDRSIQNVARLDPRIIISDRDRGEISAMGQNSRYNSITVDSVNAGDPFGLNANGLPTIGTPISVDTIEEYNISTANYNVNTRRGVGANINAVTKSGTNSYKGSVYYAFQNANRMIGKDEAGNRWQGFNREWTGGVTVGGPIVRDTLFFFASLEKSIKTSPAGSWGPEGSGQSNIVQGLSQDETRQIIDLATQKGLIPGTYAASSASDLTDKRGLVKLDWNINTSHRASLTLQQTRETQPIITNSYADKLVLDSGYYLNDTDNKSAALHFYDDWSPNFSTEFAWSNVHFNKLRGPLSGTPQPDVTVSTVRQGPQVQFGTEYSSHANELDVKTDNAYLAGTWYAGDHTILAGADYQKDRYYNLFLQNLYGSYVFDSIADFAAGNYYSYRLALPAAGYTLDNVAARFGLAQYGLFVQDAWQVNYNLSLQFGLRYDRPSVDRLPTANGCFAAPVGAAGVGKHGACENVANANPNGAQGGFGFSNQGTINGNHVLQPRFSFNYQFDAERMMQLRGGAGLFISNTPGVWLANPFSGNGVAVTSYYITSGTKPPFSADPFKQNVPANSSTPGAGGSKMRVDTVDANLKLPTVWKFSLGFDHELPWLSTVFTAEYEYLKARDAIWYQNLNLGAPTGTLPDGRLSFYKDPKGSPADRANTNRYNANPSFDSVTYLTNTSKGWADNLSLSLKKSFADDWSASFGVSGGRGKDVNPGTSSVAYSSYQNRAWVNPNEAELANSNFAVPLRVIASLTWQHRFFADHVTSISAFFDGHNGAPYSWIFGNDVNGDAVSRDLVYIPTGVDDVAWAPKVTDAMKQDFMRYVDADSYLKKHKGSIASRNGARAPWVSQLDLSFRQEIPGFFDGHKGELRLDFYNFTNLLNKRWGVERRADFPLTRQLADSAGVDASGKYIYDISNAKYQKNGKYSPATLKANEFNNPSQRWSVLMTVRYSF